MTTFGEKVKDWYTQGLQVNNCYQSDWNEIKSHFSRYGISLKEHGPVITMNELKYVREAARLTEKFVGTEEYNDLTKTRDQSIQKSNIFMLNMYTLPYFARAVSAPLYEVWISNPDNYLKKIYELDGTMKNRDNEIERIIQKAIVFLRKK